MLTALCVDDATCDGDVATGNIIATADTGCPSVAGSADGATLDNNVTTGNIIATADTSAILSSDSVEGSVTLDGQCLVFGDIDAGIIVIESPYAIHAIEYDGGVAKTSDARPRVNGIIITIDSCAIECHDSSVSNTYLHVLTECAGEHVTVLCLIVGGERREVHGIARSSHWCCERSTGWRIDGAVRHTDHTTADDGRSPADTAD